MRTNGLYSCLGYVNLILSIFQTFPTQSIRENIFCLPSKITGCMNCKASIRQQIQCYFLTSITYYGEALES